MLAVVGVTVMFMLPVTASAETSTSTNYKVTETEFNSGTSVRQACSSQYCAIVSIGDPIDRSSNLSTASFGPTDPADPSLDVIVEPGPSDLGTLTTEHTAAKLMIVKIRNYLSDGYILQIIGNPPSYSGRALHTDSTPTASVAGTEQFGINVVKNTTPNYGADPVQTPSGSDVFGKVEPNYNQADKFMYKSGDVVAESVNNLGQTDYTVTMVVNVSGNTPAGHYSSDFSAVVIPTF